MSSSSRSTIVAVRHISKGPQGRAIMSPLKILLSIAALWLCLGAIAHAGTVTYVYSDPQGTPLAEADANGTITATFDYRPYGVQALGAAPNGPGYTGHVNDPDTGLVYMQARYYDPSVGRFLSVDPAGPSAGGVFDFNRFAYVDNNPVVRIDPDGRVSAATDAAAERQKHAADEVKKGRAGAESGSLAEKAAGIGAFLVGAVGTIAKSSADLIDKDKIVQYIDQHARKGSRGQCAAYCRRAFEAGGVDTSGHPVDAKDYGPLLLRNGASIVSQDGYKPVKADVAVFAGSEAHIHGHIAVYDGKQWVSDFKQKNMSPYRTGAPPVVVYRFPNSQP